MNAQGWRLRLARFEDAPVLYAIEQRAHAYPWSRNQFDEILDSDTLVLVAENADAQCLGYAVLSVAVDDADLLNLAVDPQQRRRGLGRFLLQGILACAKERGVVRCFLEVRTSNRAAITLYRHDGFAEVGRRMDYYPAHYGREDALVMCLDLDKEA